MNILVINGSPKGKYSITLQTVNYLSKLYPRHTFDVLDVGKKIKAFEKDFSPAAKALERAELLLTPTRSTPLSPPINCIAL